MIPGAVPISKSDLQGRRMQEFADYTLASFHRVVSPVIGPTERIFHI
jgi:hypothetical protein